MASVKKINSKTGTVYKVSVYLGRDEHKKQRFYYENYEPAATGAKAAEKEAIAYAQILEKKIRNGEDLSARQLTFSDLVKRWQTSSEAEDLTASVRENYERDLKNHVLPVIGSLKLDKIKPFILQDLIDDLKARVKPATVKKIATAINSVYRYGFRLEILDSNPMDRVKLPSIRKAENLEEEAPLHYFDINQALRFLSALDQQYTATITRKTGTRRDADGIPYTVNGYSWEMPLTISKQWKAYFTLAILAGFRRGEMIGLIWSDIDFDKNTVSIKRAAADTREKGMIIKQPKTKDSRRTLTLPDECLDALAEWQHEQKKICRALGSAWEGQSLKHFDLQPVFCTDTGKLMHLSTPSHKFKEILSLYNGQIQKEADQLTDPAAREKKLAEKLPEIRLHDLRHTAASIMVAQGLNVKTISARLGHAKTGITLDRYAHALPSEDQKAAAVLSAVFYPKDRQEDPENKTTA